MKIPANFGVQFIINTNLQLKLKVCVLYCIIVL